MPQQTSPQPPDPNAIAKILAQFSIFKGIPESELALLDAKRPRPVRPGVTLFKQGNIISSIYLIESGEVELVRVDSKGRKLRRVVRAGQVLGRLELDEPDGQLGTAKTLTTVQLILVEKSMLDRLRAQHPELQSRFDRSDVIGNLRANPYFAPLSDSEIKWISDIVVIERVEPGITLYERGEPARDAVIIRQGRVQLVSGAQGQQQERWVSAGSVIGYREALASSRYRSTATVRNESVIIRLPKDDLLAVTRLYPNHNWLTSPIPVERLLRQTPIFRNFKAADIRQLAGYVMQVHHHYPHRTIVEAGKYDPYYYILARGTALQQRFDDEGNPLSSITISKGASFGQDSLLFGDPSEVTVETLSPTDWIRIHREDFQLFMDANPESKEMLGLAEKTRSRLLDRIYLGDWQRKDEEILSMRRRHWIVLAKRMVLVGAALFIQFIIASIIRLITDNWYTTVNLVIAGLYALPWSAWVVLDYLNDFHIVTSYRVIHQEKVVFVKERRISAPIEQIQNIDIERDMLAQFLKYGHLVISTAATAGQLVFDHHPNPNEAYDIIVKEMTRIKKFGGVGRQEMIQKQLQERLHLGLEERIGERALLDAAEPRKLKQPRDLPFIRLLGLQQEADNRLVWRRHWFGMLVTTFPPMMTTLAILSLLILTIVAPFNLLDQIAPLKTSIAVFSGIALAISLFWLWWRWEDWANDRYIVSDQLIERIAKKPLWFDEERTTLSLERVQNVEFSRPNPLAFLLDYGDVFIQTAASDGLIKFGFVPAPDEVQYEIFHRIKDYQENLDKKRLREQENAFADWLEAYHKLTIQEQNSRATS